MDEPLAAFAVVYHRPTDAASAASPTPSRAVIATPEVSALAVSPDGRRIYVGNWKRPTVSVIDTATNVVTALISVPQEPKGLAVSADGAYLYVASSDAVSAIATASNTTIGSAIADSGTVSRAVVVSRDGARLYVADGLRPTVTVRDARTRDTTATIPLGSANDAIDAIALTPDGRHLFAAKHGQIAMIDTTTATVTARTAIDEMPELISASPDGRSVYAMGRFSSNLYVLDAATGAEIGTVKLKGMSTGIAVSPSGRYVFIANKPYLSGGSAGDITVLDSASRTVVGEIQSGIGAGHLVVTPNGRRLYASPLETDGSGVAVIDISRYS
ncbi:beta-propeller fold lactonase family protein [Nocardia gipuzkoensis]